MSTILNLLLLCARRKVYKCSEIQRDEETKRKELNCKRIKHRLQICRGYMCLMSSEETKAQVAVRDDLSVISPPTGITVCSSSGHRQREIGG